MVNYKIKKDKIGNNKRLMLLGIIALAIIAVIVLIIVLWTKKPVETKEPEVNTPVVLKNVNGKLSNYITSLGNEYYIKYTGKFGKKSLNTSLVDTNVEYTKDGEKSAIYSEDINIHVVMNSEYAYNIMHKQKMLLKAKIPVRFSTEPYNLVSDFGQIYVKEVETNIDGVDYVYQEYTYDDAKIRYYFIGEELSYIRIAIGNDDRKINIRVEKKAKDELFEMPTNYTNYDV